MIHHRQATATTILNDVESGHRAISASSIASSIMSKAPAAGRSFPRTSYHMELCEYDFSHHPSTTKNTDKDNNESSSSNYYERYKQSHPLVYSMLQGEETRTRQLRREGEKQIIYPKSNEGWWTSLRVIEGRALGSVCFVWCFVVAHAVVYTCLHQPKFGYRLAQSTELSSWETFFGISLNMTLSLMLVFRQNRAAARWWQARELWGLLVARVRSMTSAILAHGGHDPLHRDEAIRWTAVFTISVMEFLRGYWDDTADDSLSNRKDDYEIFAGILTREQVELLRHQSHPPLFAGEQVHHALKSLFRVTADTPLALSTAWSHQLAVLEQDFSALLDKCGGMERIKATPLPMVFVSHLRTFLVLALLLYPYVWGAAWGWSTIPIVALAAFALLGIEAASAEVEQPFRKHAVNALNMDGYCIGALSNIVQMIRQHADRELADCCNKTAAVTTEGEESCSNGPG